MIISIVKLITNLIIISILWGKSSGIGDGLAAQGVFGGEYYSKYFGSLFLYCFCAYLILRAINSFFNTLEKAKS